MKRKNIWEWLLQAGIALALSLICCVYVKVVQDGVPAGKKNLLLKVITAPKMWIVTVFMLLVTVLCFRYGKQIAKYIYQYRFVIALLVFAGCILFEINGSSIGRWCEHCKVQDEDILLGTTRPIRSDEWAVFTPMMISQYYNYPDSFPYYSNTVRGCATDVFLEYGQPVKNVLMIFRPFYLGYLFLPVAKGMAFFWCGRWIALFLVSFEFGMLITKKKKGLSAVMACMITLAPVVQWWFAINGFVEMLIYTQLSVLMLWNYMNTASLKRRLLYIFVIVVCAGGYILTFYPSWQIPLAYILLGLIIWTIRENYAVCKMRIRDWISVVCGILLLVGAMLYLYHMSGDTITALMGTVYPGSRTETGGSVGKEVFNYISNIWYAMAGDGTNANVCESADFIDLFPLCYILYAWNRIKKEKIDSLSFILFCVNIGLGIYCMIGFPEWLAKVTLLSFCQGGRAVIGFQFSGLLLLIRSVALLETQDRIEKKKIAIAALLALTGTIGTFQLRPEYFTSLMCIGMFVVFTVIFGAVLQYGNRTMMWIGNSVLILVMVLSGSLVNPVRKGIDSVESLPVVQDMKKVCETDPGAKWAVTDCEYPETNIGLLAGAPTINSTNVYPALERWKLLDENGEKEDVYNRYAHIRVELKEEGPAEFEIGETPDAFCLKSTVQDLKKLEVSYILTPSQLAEYEARGEVKLVTESGKYNIYQVVN